jgi:hypothetical protein
MYDLNLYFNNMYGISYEYYVINNIIDEYEQIWHWKDFPLEKLKEILDLENKNILDTYKDDDIGFDVIGYKNNEYYFIQCKNFTDTITVYDLSGFYFFISTFKVNGIVYYNGKLSQRIIDLYTNKIKYINLPFNNNKKKI